MTSQRERQRIYNNYRAALKSARGVRAAERRQQARQITVKRYNISYNALKNIIEELDKENGITHEHTEQYKLELASEKANKSLKGDEICPSCKSNSAENGPVRYRYDPYSVIFDDYILMLRCLKCHMEKERDC